MKYLWIILATLLLAGCAQKMHYDRAQAYFIVIKNPKIALADTGFIKKNNREFNLQIFALGTPIYDLHVGEQICESGLCVSGERFNLEFFGAPHYASLLADILDAKPIYAGQNLVQTKEGFMQKITTESYDIDYRVDAKTLSFRDSVQNTRIKLRKLP